MANAQHQRSANHWLAR